MDDVLLRPVSGATCRSQLQHVCTVYIQFSGIENSRAQKLYLKVQYTRLKNATLKRRLRECNADVPWLDINTCFRAIKIGSVTITTVNIPTLRATIYFLREVRARR